jgi:hypothetical protein
MARRLVRWHPIYIEPIEGSAERLTIAIAGGTADEVRFKMIEGFRETFGPKIEAVLAARRPMLDAVADALRNGPVDLLASVESLGPGLFVGAARQVMTSDIDAALEAAARITSSVFNAEAAAQFNIMDAKLRSHSTNFICPERPVPRFATEDIWAIVSGAERHGA